MRLGVERVAGILPMRRRMVVVVIGAGVWDVFYRILVVIST